CSSQSHPGVFPDLATSIDDSGCRRVIAGECVFCSCLLTRMDDLHFEINSGYDAVNAMFMQWESPCYICPIERNKPLTKLPLSWVEMVLVLASGNSMSAPTRLH